MSKYIAFDIGASSGRAIVGILEDNKIKLDEIYRFPNDRIQIDKSLVWNIQHIFRDILNGISKYVEKYGSKVDGLGIDTWGVDFVLLDKNDQLVGYAHHYRDSRTQGVYEHIFKKISKETIFLETGIQFMELNSLVQLYSLVLNKSPHLSNAETFLMVPDYFNFLLSGKKLTEYSIASTTQLYNPTKHGWSSLLIKKLQFNSSWFQEIIPSGSVLGIIKDNIAKEVGIDNTTKIIAPACHDTGSAVVAVPVNMKEYSRGEWAYLSSGTWSLLGVELEKPVIKSKVLEYNFTNEGGFDNSIRFLKNVTGLWIIQECKRIWDQNGIKLNWDDIVSKALNAKPFQYFIDPDDSIFLNPENMVYAIQTYCINNNQNKPKTIEEISRCIFESLAFKYKEVFGFLEELINKEIKILHVIGGGASNKLLNQFIANSLDIPIKVGPIEATAIGNILIQAHSLGQINDISELRKIVLNSFNVNTFYPENEDEWEENYLKYKKITNQCKNTYQD